MSIELKTLDTVALQRDLPEKGLRRGQVGTLVEALDDGEFEVEFSDESGKPYAFAALPSTDLLKLIHSAHSEAA